MGYLAAFNTGSNPSGSIRTSNVNLAYSPVVSSGSFGKIWADAPIQAYGLTIVTDSFTQSLSTAANARPIYYSAKFTDGRNIPEGTIILETINKLPERKNQTPFTSAGSALEWINQSGKYLIVNNYIPQTAPSGVALYLDAGDLSSYPQTGSNWYDLSGNKYNGTLTNSPVWNLNPPYFSFDGVNEKFSSSLSLGNNTTFDFVFKTPQTINEYNPIFCIYRYTTVPKAATDVSYFAVISGSSIGGRKFKAFGGSLSEFRTASQYEVSPNKWTHVTLVNNYSTLTASLYVNNTFQGFTTGVITAPTASPSYNAFSLGSSLYFNNSSESFGAVSISQFKAYDTVLTPSQVAQNYFGGPIVTESLSFAIDPGNLVSYQDNGQALRYAYNLINTSESASLYYQPNYTGSFRSPAWVFYNTDPILIELANYSSLNYSSSDAFSAEIWINPTGGSQGAKLIAGNISNWNLTISPANLDGVRRYNNYTFTTSASLSVTGSDVSGLGTWQHLVGTYTNGTSSLYVNGILQSTATGSVGIVPNDFVFLGIDNSYSFDIYQGLFGPFRFYQKALTATEVRQNFAAFSSYYPNPYTSSILTPLGTPNFPVQWYYSLDSLAGFYNNDCNVYVGGFGDPLTGLCAPTAFDCSNGWYGNSLTGLCTPSCPSGYYLNLSTNTCVATCPFPTFGDPTTGTCVNACPNGYYSSNPTRLCVTTCPSFTYANPNTNQCVNFCPVPFYADDTTNSCVLTCPSGLYALDPIRTCVVASSCGTFGLYADDTTNTCTEICPYPFFADPTTNRCVMTCPAGTTPNVSTMTCD